MRKLITTAIGGMIAAFFLDPTSGRRRRAQFMQHFGGFFRRRGAESARVARRVGAETYGVTQKVIHLREARKPQPDDATLTAKVESELFRDPDIPKGDININSENGVVVLRGQVLDDDMRSSLERKARRIQGVQDVQNLLHLPGETAQEKPETPPEVRPGTGTYG